MRYWRISCCISRRFWNIIILNSQCVLDKWRCVKIRIFVQNRAKPRHKKMHFLSSVSYFPSKHSAQSHTSHVQQPPCTWWRCRMRRKPITANHFYRPSPAHDSQLTSLCDTTLPHLQSYNSRQAKNMERTKENTAMHLQLAAKKTSRIEVCIAHDASSSTTRAQSVRKERRFPK